MEVFVERDWRPTRDASAIDTELTARLRRALFDLDGRRLHRSIRIPPGKDEDWESEYLTLAGALGAGSECVAGWWVGDAGETVDESGEPDVEVPLDRGSDLDLAVWRIASDQLREIVGTCGLPTVLATSDPGWVLVAPPASDDMFLYPEVPASGA